MSDSMRAAGQPVDARATSDRLRENRLFRLVFEEAPVGIVIGDEAGTVLHVNERFGAMLGYEPRELAGASYRDITDASNVAESAQVIRDAAAERGRSYRLHKTYRRRDGSPCRAWVTVSHVDDPGLGEVMVALVEDLSESERTAERLRFQGQLLASVEESVVATDLGGRVRYWGGGAEKLYGYSAQQAEGRPLTSLIGIAGSTAGGPNIARVLEKGSWSGELRQRRADGSTFWAYTHVSLIRDALGAPAGFVCIDRDITEGRQAELALRRSEQRFRELAERIREVFWVSDPRMPEALYISPAYDDIWGRPREPVYADPRLFLESVHPDDRERVRRSTELQLAGQETIEEYRIHRPDGTERWILDRAFPVLDRSGRVQRVVGIAEDVTERRRASQEKLELERRMEHVQRLESLGVLAGGVAHDFNNILTAILGHVSLASEHAAPDRGLQDHLGKIRLGAERAAEITNLMLAYSGRSTFVIGPLDVSELVEEMARLLETTVPRHVTMRFVLPNDLPPISGDAGQLRQVVLNLITNAAEAIPDSGGRIRLATGVLTVDRSYLSATFVDDDLPGGDYVFLECADTGRGMDEATRARIFDPFFTTKVSGRGLGLAAVLGIVRGHRGAIAIDSKPECGTVIRVLLPLAGAEARTPDAR